MTLAAITLAYTIIIVPDSRCMNNERLVGCKLAGNTIGQQLDISYITIPPNLRFDQTSYESNRRGQIVCKTGRPTIRYTYLGRASNLLNLES
jgi:hypothetical protein